MIFIGMDYGRGFYRERDYGCCLIRASAPFIMHVYRIPFYVKIVDI
jgi:hypothetical protein